MLNMKLIEDFEQQLMGEKRSTDTIKSYISDLNLFYKFLEDRDIQDLKDVKIGVLHDYKNNFLSLERGNANSTINRRIASLKSYFDYLVSYEILSTNSVTQIKSSKTPDREVIYLKKKEIKKLMAYVKDNKTDRDIAILTIFLRTGMRLSELVSMNYDALDFNTGECQIIGKGNKQRTIFIDEECIDSIKTYCAGEQRNRQLLNSNDPEALFLSNKGNRISTIRLEKLFTNIFAEVFGEDNNFTIHKLRHTALTMLYEETGDIRLVQEIAGHTDVNTTTIYAHVNKDRVRNAMRNRAKLSSI